MITLAIALGLVTFWHTWWSRWFERDVATRRPLGDDGIVTGAGPIRLGHGGRGVLLLHGFGDTPQSLSAVAHHLHRNGWTVRAPLLAGHGRSLRAFSDSRAGDWEDSARAALQELRAECDGVALVGQSMGGAIATLLSIESPGVSSLVLLAPYFRLQSDALALARWHAVVWPLIPYLRSRNDGSLRDATARHNALGIGVTSPRLLWELHGLVSRALAVAPRVSAPTLVVHSRHDPRIPVADAESAWARLGPETRELVWLEHSAHVLAMDVERDLVARHVQAWLEGSSRREPGGSAVGGIDQHP